VSNGGELFALREDIPSQPNFELTLKGYNKRQVDRYVSRADAEIATLAAEREQAFAQVQELAAQVAQQQAELEDLRRRPSKVERASFQHLGPMVEQMLALAEQQA
jgi:cell division septum initiation protein DivIVA